MNYSVEKKLYLLYFFLLPFGKLFRIDELLGTSYMFVNISSFVMLLGIIRIISSGHPPSFPHMNKWWFLYAFASLYSFVWAFAFYDNGTVAGKTSFGCLPRSIVLNFLAILSIYYNSVAFSRFVKFEDIVPVVKKQSVILLSLGYIQLGMLYGIPGCAQINDALGSIFTICQSDKLISGDRGITLFGAEPSSIGVLMIVTIPFILALDIKERKWRRTTLWSILFLSSGSSQALIMFIIGIIVALYVRIKKKILRIFYISSFTLGMFMAFFYTYGIDVTQDITNDGSFSYMLYGKMVDTDNHSTATRVSTIINDVKIFAEYPLTGVGDGMQAFFYKENTPVWCAQADEVQEILEGKIAASGGGNFFATFISAYGIIGLLLMAMFVIRYRKDLRKYLLPCDNVVVVATSISIIIFLAAGWYTISFFNNEYVPLMFSLPYLGLSLKIKVV